MSYKKLTSGLLALAIVSLSGPVDAALIDRGSGLLYDDVLNVTWLQDANYAKTSGYAANGWLTYSQANTWASDLVYHDSVRNVDYDDWRLPTVSPVGVDWNYNFSYNGSTDFAYNITSPNNELAYMYYVNLGLKGTYSPSQTFQPDFGIFGNGTAGGQNDVGLVKNLQSSTYWTGTEYPPFTNNGWQFNTVYGSPSAYSKLDTFYVWALRSGDVAALTPVPEPETYALFLAGLGFLGWASRKNKFADKLGS